MASGTSLGATIPAKYHEGGSEAFVSRLKDPQVRAAIRQQLAGAGGNAENMWRGTGGPQGILVASVLDPALKAYEGKTIAQIAAEEHKEPLDALMDLVVAGKDHVGAVYFTMNEDDVKFAMQQPFVSVGTDAGAVNVQGPLSESKVHPRAYGSFPRILGRYVRDQHLLARPALAYPGTGDQEIHQLAGAAHRVTRPRLAAYGRVRRYHHLRPGDSQRRGDF